MFRLVIKLMIHIATSEIEGFRTNHAFNAQNASSPFFLPKVACCLFKHGQEFKVYLKETEHLAHRHLPQKILARSLPQTQVHFASLCTS